MLQSFLLYLVTLSLLSKLLLYTHNIISHFNILSESVGVVFLVVIILMKKRRVKSQRALRRERPRTRLVNKEYKLHRGNQQLTIDESGIKPGDIIKMGPQQQLPFDGIVLEVEKSSNQGNYHASLATSIVVSQKGHQAKPYQCCKHSIRQAELCDDLDPFLFRGSAIQEGTAWILVCIVGSRRREEHYNEAIEQRWMGLSKVSQVTKILKAAISFPILGLGVQWLSLQGGYFQSYLQLLKVVSSLLLYLSYVNENEMLWLIGRYFVQQQQDQNYKITNPKLMQQLGKADIIVIQDSYYSKKLQCLSQLAIVHDIKIVTTKEPSAIQKDFAFQITPHSIYQDVQTHSLSHRLDLLIQAKFISCDFPYFCQYYLALLEEMGFKVLLIGCHQKQKFNDNKSSRRIDECIKVRDQTRLLQVVVDLHRKSRMMKKMRDCYLCVLVNSCLQLLIMTIWACGGRIVQLNLNLLIIYTNRNRSTQLFKEWRQVTPSHSPHLEHSWWTLNLILFIYYIYMMIEIFHSNDQQFLLFLLLMTNRLFRLYPLHPRIQVTSKRFLLKISVVIGLMTCDAVVRHYEGKDWQVQSQWGSILVLPLIIWLYGTFYDL